MNVRLILIISLITIAFGCATSVARPNLTVALPPRPSLEIGLQIDPQCYRINGNSFPCIWFSFGDWRAVRAYYLSIEKELKAICLALGNSEQQCSAEK